MNIKTIDLINIHQVAKSMKQSEIAVYNNRVIGLDDINIRLLYSNQIMIDFINGIVMFNYKELSEFIKGITIETDFELNDNRCIINNIGTELHFKRDTEMIKIITGRYNVVIADSNDDDFIDITQDMQHVVSMKVADGTYNYICNYNNKEYFMTLFGKILPLNKSDKVFVKIKDSYSGSRFISTFRIEKKKSTLYSVVAFLRV